MKKLNITPENFTRIDSDYYGNPRYYISVVALFPICEDERMINKVKVIDRLRKGSILTKYRGKKYGAGYVIQSYNLQASCDHINNFFNNKNK